MDFTKRLDLAQVLSQLEEAFLSAEEEYESPGEEHTVETDSGSDGEDQIIDMRSVSTAEQVDVMADIREEEELLQDDSTVVIKRSFEDKEQEEAIAKFILETCGCTLGPKKSPCSSQLSKDTIALTRNNCLQLTRSDQDLVIMAQLNALRTNVANKPSSYRGKAESFRPFTKFYLHGIQICRKTFCFVHAVGRERVENLCKVIDTSGVVQRIHGNTKRPRHNQIKEAEVIQVRDFITNVGNTHGSPLPGRLLNASEKTLLLPSDMPKNKVYKDYKAVCEQIMVTPVGRSKFYELWQSLIPSIDTMKPSSDLCFECQQNITQIMRSAHLSEEEKSERLKHAEAHLHLAKVEHERYNRMPE